MIESNLLPPERKGFNFNFLGPPTELKPFSLWYRNSPREAMYRAQPDTHFRFDLNCAFVLYLSIALVQLIGFEKLVSLQISWNIINNVLNLFFRNIALIGSLAASFISLTLFLYLSNIQVPEINASTTDRNGPGQVVASSRYIRLAIFIIVNILISATAVFNVVSNPHLN